MSFCIKTNKQTNKKDTDRRTDGLSTVWIHCRPLEVTTGEGLLVDGAFSCFLQPPAAVEWTDSGVGRETFGCDCIGRRNDPPHV